MNSNETLDGPRRAWLQAAVRVAVGAPLGIFVAQTMAAQNGPTRGWLKYQDSPNMGKDCLGCVEFVPGKTPKDGGGCRVIPGDDEISPNGWCFFWDAKK